MNYTDQTGQLVALAGSSLQHLFDTIYDRADVYDKVVRQSTNPYGMKMAMGGKVDVEAEGEELVQVPGQPPMEIEGPKHENGGVDMEVPEGTTFFSDRLKGPDGKTMAERKKRRERLVKKQLKEFMKDPFNAINRSSLEQTLLQSGKEEAADVLLMNMARKEEEMAKEGKAKMSKGGKANGPDDPPSKVADDKYPPSGGNAWFREQTAPVYDFMQTYYESPGFMSKAKAVNIPEGASSSPLFSTVEEQGARSLTPSEHEAALKSSKSRSKSLQDVFINNSSVLTTSGSSHINFYRPEIRKIPNSKKEYAIEEDKKSTQINAYQFNNSLAPSYGVDPIIDPNESARIIAAHEFNHASIPYLEAVDKKGNKVDKAEYDLYKNYDPLLASGNQMLFDYSKKLNPTGEKGKERTPNETSRKLGHDDWIDELHSDLQGLRYEMYKEGIFDARNSELFSKKDMENLKNSELPKKSFFLKRLLKHYSEEDLQTILNNVAYSSDQSDKQYASAGGTFVDPYTAPKVITPDSPDGVGGGIGMDMGDFWNRVGAYGPLATTIANRLGDKPNQNYFENYGVDALQTNAKSFQELNNAEASALRDISARSTAARETLDNTARSVGTKRAMSLAQFTAGENAARRSEADFSGQRSRLYSERAGLQNQADSQRMQGAERAGIADIQDRDNFYTQLSKNISNLATQGMQYSKMQKFQDKIDSGELDSILQSLYGLMDFFRTKSTG